MRMAIPLSVFSRPHAIRLKLPLKAVHTAAVEVLVSGTVVAIVCPSFPFPLPAKVARDQAYPFMEIGVDLGIHPKIFATMKNLIQRLSITWMVVARITTSAMMTIIVQGGVGLHRCNVVSATVYKRDALFLQIVQVLLSERAVKG